MPVDRVQRRLIVCCDGTWQSSVSGERNVPSNVTRLCRHLARSEVVTEKINGKDVTTQWNQVVFYDPGIGTGDLSSWDATRQGGTGAGLMTNVIEAYNFLALNYQPGDKIYCFGFSRGAYTARSLSGLVTDVGICSPMDMLAFPVLLEKYNRAVPERKGEPAEAAEHRKAYKELREKWMSGKPIPITLSDDGAANSLVFQSGVRHPIPEQSRYVEVVGVWDTVGSLGVPKIGGWLKIPTLTMDKPADEFHDVSLSDYVLHAFHALALDERRKPFGPTLWFVPKGQTRAQGTTFKQVWFPGVHINIGGGSDDVLQERKSDFEQIANITFAWMVEQTRKYLAYNEESFQWAIADQKHFLQELHGEVAPGPKSWTKMPAAWASWAWLKMNGKPYPTVEAQPGWATGNVVDSFLDASASIQAGGSEWRSPGETVVPLVSGDTVPRRTTDLGDTSEEVHPCVWYRMQQHHTKSPALKSWRRKPCPNPKDGWMWAKDGAPIVMKEYRIDPHPTDSSKPRNLERLTADAANAGDYVQKLDTMYEKGVDETGTFPDDLKMAI